ncbi:MAG: flp pilus assembly protein secretin CpaC [Betaproteobacteria bacterium]|nr:flp pilus assembly protein secretin CpaC [Betaproteobacteria bacterium]
MIPRLKILIACCAWFFLAPYVNAADEQTVLNLYVGEVKSLPLAKVQRVAVGNGKVLTANVLEQELLLLAETAGRTSLFVWTADGKQSMFDITVSANDGAATQKRLAALLSSFPGIAVERAGEHVIITGTTTKVNLARIDSMVKLFPQTLNLVREEEVTMKRMVYMKVQIIEMKKSLSESIGIAWDQTIAGPNAGLAGDLVNNSLYRIPTTPPTGFPTSLPTTIQKFAPYLGITSAITSRINLAVNNGDAFVLATPELSTRSGGEAKFLAGGQIPLATPGTAFAPPTITYKDYGIKLSIMPVADNSGNVSTIIKTEVSSIDNSVSVQGNPGFLTRSTDSEVNVQAGQTIIISGLVNSDLAKDVQRLPGLSNIPILGELFKSTNFRSNRTDLMIFVTPTVYDPTSTLNRERLDKAQDMQDKFQRQLGPKGIVD